MNFWLQIEDVNGLDFASAATTAQAAFRSTFYRAKGMHARPTLLLQDVVCVPGCVLLMATVLGPASMETDVGSESAALAALPAFDGAAWMVLASRSSSSSSSGVHIFCGGLEELLQQEGEAAEALRQAVQYQLDEGGIGAAAEPPSVAAVATGGSGGCRYGVVAQWGQPLSLRLLEDWPQQQQKLDQQVVQATESDGGTSTRSKGRGGRDASRSKSSSNRMVRVVVSRGNQVLSDRVELLLTAAETEAPAAAGSCGGAVPDAEGGVASVTSAAAGESMGTDVPSYLLLDLPSYTSSSNAVRENVGSSTGGTSDMGVHSIRLSSSSGEERRALSGAALTVALLKHTGAAAGGVGSSGIAATPQQTARDLPHGVPPSASAVDAGSSGPAIAEADGFGSGAAGEAGGDDVGGDDVPFAYVTVLLLPRETAMELEAWVLQQQVTIAELTPLMVDLAFVLDTRDALLLGVGSSPGVTSITTPGDTAAGGMLSAGELTGLADLAAEAAESLLGFVRRSGLFAAEDFVMVLCC